jgi:hypothetical protein
MRAFLCYQYREVETAKALAASFEATNLPLDAYDRRMRFQVTSDEAAETRGETKRAIVEAQVAIVVLGPTTATSSWVAWEIERARETGKPIIVARDNGDDMLPAGVDEAKDTFTSWSEAEVLAAAARVALRD